MSSGSRSSLAEGDEPAYYIAATIPYPPSLTPPMSWDISWVDPAGETLVVAERTNFGLDVYDALSNTFVRNIRGMKGVSPPGPSNGGPNGVVIVPDPKG